jgi:diaminopimelate decarboxylase
MNRDKTFKDLYQIAGGPFYALDLKQLELNYNSFKNAFKTIHPQIEIGYSYKTNYTKDIIRTLSSLGAYSEIVSRLEFDIAKSLDINTNKIIFNGPIKDFETVEKVLLGGGLVHLDSREELKLIERIIKNNKVEFPLRLGIRLNLVSPVFPSRFGFDIHGEDVQYVINFIHNTEQLELEALHVHYPQRSLDSFSDRIKLFFEFITNTFDRLPNIINLGSGFYHEMDSNNAKKMGFLEEPLRFIDYANVLKTHLTMLFEKYGHDVVLYFEPGTPLVVNCMTLVGEIFSTKRLGDKIVAASNISVFDFNPRSYPKKNPVEVISGSDRVAVDNVMIVGNTCVENDIIMESYSGPIGSGDLIIISNVGSYSNVMKPPFISTSLPILLVEDDMYIRISKVKLSNLKIIEDYK